jgi:hypothetical protein
MDTLKDIKLQIKDLKGHMNKMLSYRAVSNEITLGFLDGCEELHEQEMNKLKLKLRLLTPPKEGQSNGLLTSNDIAMAKLQPISNYLKVGPSHKTHCLFHGEDKNPSLHIYPDGYHCFSCGAHGTVIDVIMKLRNCSFTAAVRFLLGK